MKKILFLIESLGGGGAEKILATLVKNLDKTKFDITVLAVVNTGVYVDKIKKYCNYRFMLDGMESSNLLGKIKYRLDYKYIYSQPAEKVYKRFITEEYDVEVAFVEGFATKLIAASPNRRSKKICWLHIDMRENPYADVYYQTIQEERTVYKCYDKIIGVSETVKKTFEEKFELPGTVTVIYNPIDRKEILEKAGLFSVKKESVLTIVTTGRLAKQKGYDRLIHSLAQMKQEDRKCVVWILGEGMERPYLEKQIYESGLQDIVKLLGFQENPYPWVAAADVFVCSSRAEGFSLAIAEAMILGKPIVSVDCAGPNELLNFGEYGMMIENTDKALDVAIAAIVNGKVDLNHYHALTLKRQSFFELENVIRQIEKVFSDGEN